MRRLAILGLILLGCSKPSPASKHAPANAPYRQVQLDDAHRLWIYEPQDGAKGKPCVVIAPAGAHMFDGMSLGEGDIPEHLPYRDAGYVVIAYDVSGPMEGRSTADAAKAFMEADAGVADGKRTIDYALNTLGVDKDKLAVAGHSSAGTIALALAENDSRVKVCLSYAPCIDVTGHLGDSLPRLESQVPGLKEKLSRFSPLGHAEGYATPTLLFHANDDDTVPREPIAAFAAVHKSVKLVEVPTGGHYDSMIQQGIPAGLDFLRTQFSSGSAESHSADASPNP